MPPFITYQTLSENVQHMFDDVIRLCKDTLALNKIDDNKKEYDDFIGLSFEEKIPFRDLFKKLKELLGSGDLKLLVEQYRSVQMQNSPNFSDKIALTHDDNDRYREIQGLNPAQIKTMEQLKYLLYVKYSLDFVDTYGKNFKDKAALEIRELTRFIRKDPMSDPHESVTEYIHHQGFKLTQTISHNWESPHDCAYFSFQNIALPDTQSEAAVQLYRIAISETNAMRHTGPFLALNITLIQQETIDGYQQKFKTILDAQPANTHNSILLATDKFFNQTALSSAIGLDNTHAALALIHVINSSTALLPVQKQILLNHCSKNTMQEEGWSEDIYSSTPLLLAIQRGNKKVVDTLLDTSFINVNQQDLKDLTPLDWTFVMADANLMRKLLDKGADPMKAYYHTHPWQDDIWQPSKDILGPLPWEEWMYIADHPEHRQLCAHYWDMSKKFYQMRYYNPQAEICGELIQYGTHNPVRTQETTRSMDQPERELLDPQKDNQTKYPAQQHQCSDYLMMLLNYFLDWLRRFCSQIGNFLSTNPHPIRTKACTFFEDDIGTYRTVEELSASEVEKLLAGNFKKIQ